MRYTVGLALLLASLACGGSGTFVCVSDGQCVVGGAEGICQPSGGCSFPDEACPSGQRYGDLVEGALAGTCVPIEDGTGSVDPDSGGSETSAGPMPGTTLAVDGSGDDTSTSSAMTGPPADPTTTSVGSITDPTTGATTTGDGTTGPAPQPVTLHFGERDDADVSGVTRDTYISETNAGNNGGTHGDFHTVETGAPAASLLAFDISAIPAGSEVIDATLEVWTEDTGLLESGEVEIHELLEAWDEGAADNGPGVANWTERTPGQPWSTPGAGAGSSGAMLLGTLDGTEASQDYSTELPISVVQSWVDDPSGNHGLRLSAVDAGMSYHWYLSSEYGDHTRRPALFVTFLPPPPP